MAIVLEGLASTDHESQDAAERRLRELAGEGLSSGEAAELIAAAPREWPERKYNFVDTGQDLIDAAATVAAPAHVEELMRGCGGLTPEARSSALMLLAAVDSPLAAEGILGLVAAHARGDAPLARLATPPFRRQLNQGSVLFPRLLEHVELPRLGADIVDIALGFAEAGAIGSAELAPAQGTLTAAAARRRRAIEAFDPIPTGPAAWRDEAYFDARLQAGLFADLLGHVPGEDVVAELRSLAALSDPGPAGFAVCSLVRLGLEPDRGAVDAVGADPDMRNLVYDRLSQLGRRDLFPERFTTQIAFAESELVRWLTFPGEIGEVPEEQFFEAIVSDDELDCYVFRFASENAGEGWFAAVVGPYERRLAPTTEILGQAFSTFRPFEELDAEGHVEDVLGTIEEWAARREDP